MRLEDLETSVVSVLQEIRSIKADVLEQSNGTATLEPLLGVEEVAKILGVEKTLIYSQARHGKIPSIRLGKYRKFSPSQLQKWLDRKSIS